MSIQIVWTKSGLTSENISFMFLAFIFESLVELISNFMPMYSGFLKNTFQLKPSKNEDQIAVKFLV